MKNLRFAIGISFCFLLGGCTALESKKEGNATGLPYYLPKGLVNLKLKVGNNNELSFQEAQVKIIPDKDYRYTLQYQASAMSDDAIEVTTTNNGLLKEVKFTGDERSDEFIVKLAELGKEVLKATFTPFGLVKDGVYETLFDPFSKSDLLILNTNIARINPSFKIKFPEPTETSADSSQCKEINICFRTASLFPLTLVENGVETQRIYIELPDRSRIGNIQVSRSAFVKKITNLTFDNGVLTKFDITKPSESIAAIQIPIDIVKSVVSIPGELLKLKIDYSTANKGVIDAQLNELDSKQKLIEKQAEILKKDDNKGGDPINN